MPPSRGRQNRHADERAGLEEWLRDQEVRLRGS